MDSIKWVWQYAKVYKWRIFFALLLVIVTSGLAIVFPLLGGKLVDIVIDQGKVNLLVPILAIMYGVVVARIIMRYTYQILFEQIGQNTLYKIREDLYVKLQEMDFSFFNQTRVGDIMARMTGDTDAIRHFVSWVVYTLLENALLFISAVIMMATLDWRLMLALLMITPLIGYLTSRMSRQARPLFYEIRESFSRLNSMVEENIGGNRVVKAFTREGFEIEKFNQHNDDFRQRNIDSANVSRKYLPVLDALAGCLAVITLALGGYFVISGQMTLGDLVTFSGVLWMLDMPMRMSGWLINDVQRFIASSFKIREMLKAETQIPVQSEKSAKDLKGYVAFEDVSFQFPDAPDVAVLSHISLEAAPGQTIGILGETGSGKSTLVNLIARFYDPTSGVVKIDGVDARKWHVRELRDHIALVMQDIFLFSDTIEENIAFGVPGADGDEVRKMAQIADANRFIEQMPDGYDTIVGERGVGLSGGQKQRISLARALMKDPSILILDDTTSAVDLETETKIQEELDKITTDKTTFIIAHRVSSVKDADEIIIMAHGKIVERGNHESLLAQKGYYYEVYNKQLGNFDLEMGVMDNG